jgi:hypothetical protein
VLALADRVLVMNAGGIAGEISVGEVPLEEVGAALGRRIGGLMGGYESASAGLAS